MQGTVFVSFVIDKQGMITDVEVVNGFDAICDDETGEWRGKIVNVYVAHQIQIEAMSMAVENSAAF